MVQKGNVMINVERKTTISFNGEDAWQLTKLAAYVIEVIRTGTSQGDGQDKETLEELKIFANRFSFVVPNNSLV